MKGCWSGRGWVALAVVAVAALSVPAEAATVRSDHPRIFFTDEVITQVKANIASVPEVATAYNALRSRASWESVGNPSWTVHDKAAMIALVYLVEDKDPTYLTKLKAALDNLPTTSPDSWTRGFTTQAMSICYDAAYNELTPAERSTYAQGIVTLADPIFNYWRHSDYNNHVYIEYGPLVYAGRALANDGYQPTKATEYVDWAEDFLTDHGTLAFAQVGGEDGGWHESRSYHSLFTHWFVHQLLAWKSGTGEDLFPQATGLAGDAQWMIHTNQPHDGQRVAVADINTPPNQQRTPRWDETFYYLPILAYEYGDGVAQYWGKTGFDAYAFRNWPFIIGYDSTIPETAPADMPTAQVFENLGWAAMRSDWTEDATFALFVCGRHFAGHQHWDQNQFLIHKQGTLAIDAGEYGAKATECHNTILIGGNQRAWSTDPTRYVEPIEPGHNCYTGHLVAYEHTDDYTYVCGDATPAYDSAEVSLFYRQFVYLHPDLFVIYDRTESVEAEERKWMLHSLDPASIDGNEVTITNLDGALWAKMLTPDTVSVTQYQMVADRGDPGYNENNYRADN